MRLSTQERIENILTTIDQLGMAKIRHLQQIHDLKSYRNACRVVKQLETYVHITFFEKEKVIYLNTNGRKLIGSTKEVKKNSLIEHILLCNEAYLYFNCPFDWKREHVIEIKEQQPAHALGIQFQGLKLSSNKKIVSDASFSRNGYFNLIEIDNTRSMIDNKKKIDKYKEMLTEIKDHHGQTKLYIFTTSNKRKKEFMKLCDKLHCEIMTFEDIK